MDEKTTALSEKERIKAEKKSRKAEAAAKKNSAGSRRKKKKKKFVIILVIIAIILFGVYFVPKFMPKNGGATSQSYSLHRVTRRDISSTLTGTGTLQPIESYTITATVTGDVLSADFEEMDKVEEDEVLYVIDSSDLEDDIEDAREDVSDALEDYNEILEDYEDLSIVSDYTGTIRELYVEADDKVSSGGRIAYIVDSDTMLLEIPFFASNTDHLTDGSAATVTFPDSGEVLYGRVCEISNLTSVNSNNSVVRNVTIAVSNPGGITFGMQAYADAVGSDGNTYTCAAVGSFKYNTEETILSEAQGEISELLLDEGAKVYKGTVIARLSSETLDKQVEQYKKAYDNAVKKLDDLIERLEDYTVTAPISGTIVQKNYKELDTIGSSSMSSTTTLAIIYDMSKLTFELSIDELDLSLIEEGQRVNITSDSIQGEVFEGIVTKKSIVGSSYSGTTTYPVTVEIEGNDKLLPGMNINAEIIVESYENVLTLPVSAVRRGNSVERVTDGSVSLEGTRGGTTYVEEKPATETVKIEIGASDEDYIEIKSGLSEGDIVAVQVQNASDNFMAALFGGGMPQGGMGGMPQSGRPSGNMGGMSQSGRPSGNMGGMNTRPTGNMGGIR